MFMSRFVFALQNEELCLDIDATSSLSQFHYELLYELFQNATALHVADCMNFRSQSVQIIVFMFRNSQTTEPEA